MNCIKCYQEIPDGSKFCPHCGTVQPDAAEPVQAEAAQADVQPEAAPEVTSADNAAQQADSTAQNTYQSAPVYQSEPVYQSAPQQEKPVNWVPYLVLSIICTVCCCLPFGIVGIVYAAKVNSAVNAGDFAGAQKAAKTAKIWIIVSAVLGLIVEILYIVLFTAGIIGGSSYYYY